MRKRLSDLFVSSGSVLAVVSLSSALPGCVSDYSFSKAPPTVEALTVNPAETLPQSSPAPSPTPASSGPVVCNPFGNGDSSGTSEKNGLSASLTYIPATSSRANAGLTLGDFAPAMPDVIEEMTPIVLSQLNVPTVDFVSGFSDGSGNTLKNLSGEALIEWFSLSISSNLALAPGDAEGDYQLAILSDDGSIVSVDPSGSGNDFQSLIDNDATHPNRLGCASKPITLSQGDMLPIHIDYFQGPRVRIALVLLWRQVVGTPAREPECGVTENDTYYFTQTAAGPSPTAKYKALLARGWLPVPAKNFVLDKGTENPCAMKSVSR